MVNIFIGYGGPRAEEVAKKLNAFLLEQKLETFLASPNSHDLLPTDEIKTKINQNLLDCNIAVFVCHESTSHSKEIKREINFLFKNNLQHKIISFAKSDDCLPRKLRKRWHPLHFAPEKPEESFCRLLNEIFRCYIRIQKTPRMIKEDERMVRT